ncbi:hypothetical protein JXI42_14810 [bacterium]|nr:hypothetical protein [bacterium]
MKKLVLITLCILALAVSSQAQGTKTWTGEHGSNWNNPRNWDPPGVPNASHAVFINRDSPSCTFPDGNVTTNELYIHGTVNIGNCVINTELFTNNGTINASNSLIIAPADPIRGMNFTNNGDISASSALVSIGSTSASTTMHSTTIFNSGSINGSVVNLIGGTFANSGFGNVNGNSVFITSASFVSNPMMCNIRGNSSETGPGGSVIIRCDQLTNNGTIKGGYSGSSAGGMVKVYARKGLFQFSQGKFYSGNGHPDGKVLIGTQKTTSEGKISCGSSDDDKSALDAYFGQLAIYSDSIVTTGDSTVIEADTMKFFARHLLMGEIPSFGSVYADNAMYFFTTREGFLDFPGTFERSAFFTPGIVEFYSDSVKTPPEILDTIFHPEPVIYPSDSTYSNAGLPELHDYLCAGENGTMYFIIQNQCLRREHIDYSVSSAKGWVIAFTDATDEMPPFDFDSFTVEYTVPEGTPSGEVDTIIIELSIDPGFGKTEYSYLQSLGNLAEPDTVNYTVTEGWNMLSMPFHNTMDVMAEFPFTIGDAWAYAGMDSGYVELDSIAAGTGFWLLSETDTSIAVAGSGEADTVYYFLEPGWHMFGCPASVIPAESITSYPEVIGDVYGWDAILRNYFTADSLYPGLCYWMFVNDTLELTLP